MVNTQTVNITINNSDVQEQEQEQSQDASTNDVRGNSDDVAESVDQEQPEDPVQEV